VSRWTRCFTGRTRSSSGLRPRFWGSEDVSGGTPPEVPPLTAHRIRFDVDQAFRGATSSPIDVTVLDSDGANYSFTVGQRYLIFAEHTKMGGRVPAPSGYFQGVYPVETATLARNEVNGAVDLIELVEKAKRQPRSRAADMEFLRRHRCSVRCLRRRCRLRRRRPLRLSARSDPIGVIILRRSRSLTSIGECPRQESNLRTRLGNRCSPAAYVTIELQLLLKSSDGRSDSRSTCLTNPSSSRPAHHSSVRPSWIGTTCRSRPVYLVAFASQALRRESACRYRRRAEAEECPRGGVQDLLALVFAERDSDGLEICRRVRHRERVVASEHEL
jgi:hypothetical protein